MENSYWQTLAGAAWSWKETLWLRRQFEFFRLTFIGDFATDRGAGGGCVCPQVAVVVKDGSLGHAAVGVVIELKIRLLVAGRTHVLCIAELARLVEAEGVNPAL